MRFAAGQHVAQEQHDADHLARLHAARHDALGQLSSVGLHRLEGAGLQGIEVVVVDGRRFHEDLVLAHRRE